MIFDFTFFPRKYLYKPVTPFLLEYFNLLRLFLTGAAILVNSNHIYETHDKMAAAVKVYRVMSHDVRVIWLCELCLSLVFTGFPYGVGGRPAFF